MLREEIITMTSREGNYTEKKKYNWDLTSNVEGETIDEWDSNENNEKNLEGN